MALQIDSDVATKRLDAFARYEGKTRSAVRWSISPQTPRRTVKRPDVAETVIRADSSTSVFEKPFFRAAPVRKRFDYGYRSAP